MKLSRVGLTAVHLNRIPVEERALLVLCGHVVNELNVLNKWLLSLTEQDSEVEPITQAQALQAMVLLKAIAGKLNEAWEALKKGYLRNELARELDHHLEPQSLAGLQSLKKYFGRTNLINAVRNNFSFHYSIAHVTQAVPTETLDDDLAVFLAEPIGNSLYQFAEFVVNRSLLESIGEDLETAMDRLIVESQQAISWFNDLAHGLMVVVLERHVLHAEDAPHVTEVDIGEVPNLRDRKLDFFYEVSRPDTDA